MPLEQDDLKQIGSLIADQLTQFRSDFLKEEVAPMVSGATKRALSEAPQITAQQFEEQLSKLQENFKAAQADPGKLVEDAVSKVLQELANLPDEGQESGGEQGTSQAVDADILRQQIMQEFTAEQEKRDRKMREQLKSLQDQAEASKQEAEAERQRNLIAKRDEGFVNALLKSGHIDSGAGQLALQAAMQQGYIQPHPDDPGRFVVQEKDRLGLEDVWVDATERIAQLLEKPELQYFRPARPGTGTGSGPAPNRVAQPGVVDLKVLPTDNQEGVSADAILAAMKSGKGDDVLSDLAALDKAG